MNKKKHHKEGKIYANDNCSCGSGKKYKKCCKNIDEKIPERSFYEKMVNAFQKGDLVSFARIKGGNGSIKISNQSVTFGGKTINYEKPIKVSVGSSEDGNSSGIAEYNLTMDGKNKLKTIQVNSGRVHFPNQANYGVGIKDTRSKSAESEAWKAIIKIKTQEIEPKKYFDLVLLRKDMRRNHANDPHISFRPDASGKYIRFGTYSDNAEICTLSENVTDGVVVPLSTEIKFNGIIFVINYIFEEGVLYVDNIKIKNTP